jgi:hypothetical protein
MFLLAGDPHSIPTATGDPFKTLFVARIVSLAVDISVFHGQIHLICVLVIQIVSNSMNLIFLPEL